MPSYESLWCSDIWEDCVGHFRLHLASCGANRRQRLSSFFTEKSHPCSMYVLFWPDLPQVRHSMHLSVWLIQNIANERACKTTQFWTLRKKWTKGPSVWRLSSSSMDQVLSALWLPTNMCSRKQTSKIWGLFGIGILLTGFWFPGRMDQLRWE